MPALRECLEALDDGTVGVVVTHGASLRVGMLGLLGWPQTQARDLCALSNCGRVVLAEDEARGRLRLQAYDLRADPAPRG